MGQSESTANEDDNCFRACVKQNKGRNKKIQALPYYPQKKDSRFDRKSPETEYPHQEQYQHTHSPGKHNNNANAFETSIDYRLSLEQAKLKKKNSLQNSTNIVTNDPKDANLMQKSLDNSKEIVLGLQSKFSSSKHAYSFTTAKINSQKGNVDRNSAGTRCSSHEKQSGSQTQITNKTSQTSSSNKSRKILLNKIEEIKQKYYERELEIEICHDEREYQEQIDKINHIDRTFVDNSELPEQSIGEIKAIRNKILAKLREKKEKNTAKNEITKTIDDHSLHLTVNQSLTIHDHLEIYSRDGKILFEETLIESQTLKKSKRMRNNLSQSGRGDVYRSVNTSRPECSIDQKMQFSQYSQESLHQIRELDEEYEDYRSKVTGLSNFKNNQNGFRPQDQIIPGVPRSGIASRFNNPNMAHSDLLNPSQNLSKAASPEQSQPNPSSLTTPKPRQQGASIQVSKSNKILLF